MSERPPAGTVGLPRRLLLGVLLAIGGGLSAFVAGAVVGARFLVAPGAGLAGPAEVVGYGLLAAAAAMLAAVLVAVFARWRPLLIATATTTVVALAAAAGLAFLVLRAPGPPPAPLEAPAPSRTVTAPGQITSGD